MIESNEYYIEIDYPNESFNSSKDSSNNLIKNGAIINDPTYSIDASISNHNTVIDENSIVQNIFNIILTRPGERINNPRFGCRVHELIFSLYEDEDSFSRDVIEIIDSAIVEYEPRATLDKLNSFVIMNDPNSFDVVLYITIPTGEVKTIKVTINSIGK
jgi:phage baseplate assembly protein W